MSSSLYQQWLLEWNFPENKGEVLHVRGPHTIRPPDNACLHLLLPLRVGFGKRVAQLPPEATR